MPKSTSHDFTEGPIVGPFIRFALPIMGAMFIQSFYGAADMAIVGRFASAPDLSGVATGNQVTMTFMMMMMSFAISITILLGQALGARKNEEGGKIVGSGIFLCLALGLVLTGILIPGAPFLARFMNAPQEAFSQTVSYIRICGLGMTAIISYNLIGSIFRGIGDSRTPLTAVIIASIFNVFLDLLFVAVFEMGAPGAAWATIISQTASVLFSLLFIRNISLPFPFKVSYIRFSPEIAKRLLRLGLPLTLQDILVSLSFLLIMVIVNSLGLLASASIGVAESVCRFIMLIPGAFAQSTSAFVAQNVGAEKYDRALRTLRNSITLALGAGIFVFYISFFHGEILTGIFTNNPSVIAGAADYLKAYAIDCLLTSILFSSIGFFNGIGFTRFVMIQGIVGSMLVRVPVSWLMSLEIPPRLFHIGLATPCSTFVQILLCMAAFIYVKKRGFHL